MTDDGPGLDDEHARYYAGMVAARKRLVRPLVITVLLFYFTLAVLTNFTPLLDTVAFGGLTWAYLYAFAQFVMVIVLTTVYRRGMDRAESRLRPAEANHTVADDDLRSENRTEGIAP